MGFHSIEFFVDTDEVRKGQGPEVTISSGGRYWPIRVTINPGITIHLSTESQLIAFVNSVKSSYNKYRKEKGYDH